MMDCLRKASADIPSTALAATVAASASDGPTKRTPGCREWHVAQPGTPAIVALLNSASPAAALPETASVLCTGEAVSTTSRAGPSVAATGPDDGVGVGVESLSPPPQDDSKKSRGRQLINDRIQDSYPMPGFLSEMVT
jgi:hypothetical protein